MKYFCVAILMSIFCICFAYAQQSTQVQISRERDTQGKWTSWSVLTVVWGTEPTPAEDVPDHMSRDDDVQQDWYVPFRAVDGVVTWYEFNFTVDQAGEYAVRLSKDGVLWSDPESCIVEPPDPPRHGD